MTENLESRGSSVIREFFNEKMGKVVKDVMTNMGGFDLKNSGAGVVGESFTEKEVVFQGERADGTKITIRIEKDENNR